MLILVNQFSFRTVFCDFDILKRCGAFCGYQRIQRVQCIRIRLGYGVLLAYQQVSGCPRQIFVPQFLAVCAFSANVLTGYSDLQQRLRFIADVIAFPGLLDCQLGFLVLILVLKRHCRVGIVFVEFYLGFGFSRHLAAAGLYRRRRARPRIVQYFARRSFFCYSVCHSQRQVVDLVFAFCIELDVIHCVVVAVSGRYRELQVRHIHAFRNPFDAVEDIALLQLQLACLHVVAVDHRALGLRVLLHHDVAFAAHGQLAVANRRSFMFLHDLVCPGRQILPLRALVPLDLDPHFFSSARFAVLLEERIALLYCNLVFLVLGSCRRAYYVLLDYDVSLVPRVGVRRCRFDSVTLHRQFNFRRVKLHACEGVAFDLRDVFSCLLDRVRAQRQIPCLRTFSGFHRQRRRDVRVRFVRDHEYIVILRDQFLAVLVHHRLGDFDLSLVLLVLVLQFYCDFGILLDFSRTFRGAAFRRPRIVRDNVRIPGPCLFSNCVAPYRQPLNDQRLCCAYFKFCCVCFFAERLLVRLQVFVLTVPDRYLELRVFIPGYVPDQFLRYLQVANFIFVFNLNDTIIVSRIVCNISNQIIMFLFIIPADINRYFFLGFVIFHTRNWIIRFFF